MSPNQVGLGFMNKTHDLSHSKKHTPVEAEKMFKKQKSLVPISKELFMKTETKDFLKNLKLAKGMAVSIIDSKS